MTRSHKGQQMRFVIATSDFSGLGMAVRLQDEGHSAVLAVQPPEPDPGIPGDAQFRLVGNNLVDKRPLAEVMATRNQLRECYWIWDGNHSVRENELLRSEGFHV